MVHNRLQDLLVIITLLNISSIISMGDPNVPTINFKDKTKKELNRFAIENEVHELTPRSKRSLKDKIEELGITVDSGEFIYTALTSDGSMPARPGDVIKFITTKQYYAQYKQMPPDSYRPIIMLQASTREKLESMLNGLFSPNGVSCVYPDLPTVTYGPGVMQNTEQDTEEDFGLRSLFQESCSLR